MVGNLELKVSRGIGDSNHFAGRDYLRLGDGRPHRGHSKSETRQFDGNEVAVQSRSPPTVVGVTAIPGPGNGGAQSGLSY